MCFRQFCNLNDLISLNLGRGESRDHLSRVNFQKKTILHKNILLEAMILGKRLNLRKMSKISLISGTHALIQVSSHFFVQTLYLTWLYVVLIGDLKMFFSFVIISNFCLVPVPLQWIYVVIGAKEINISNRV